MTPPVVSTKTDAGATEWRIDDDVLRLRLWGTEMVYALPAGDGELVVGAAERCAIRLVDESGRVSREHARLGREQGRWVVRDLKSRNGILIDGARRTAAALEPGIEIGFGGLTLIAESARFAELRAFVSRLVGWGVESIATVDLALRAVRTAAARRAPLVLCGDGDLVAIAHELHRQALGEDRPFVVCDPRRQSGEATVRSPKNFDKGMAAMAAATGGSVCLWAKRTPRDMRALDAAVRNPGSRVQLVVCAAEKAHGKSFLVAPISIPSLADRAGELSRIIDEYARDARTTLDAAAPFSTLDHEWIVAHSAGSLPEIEKGTLRLVAIRKAGSVAAAAELLGMSHTSLLRWLGRRKLPAKR